MKTYVIDADGNALLRVSVDKDSITVIDAINGWGESIVKKVEVQEEEEE